MYPGGVPSTNGTWWAHGGPVLSPGDHTSTLRSFQRHPLYDAYWKQAVTTNKLRDVDLRQGVGQLARLSPVAPGGDIGLARVSDGRWHAREEGSRAVRSELPRQPGRRPIGRRHRNPSLDPSQDQAAAEQNNVQPNGRYTSNRATFTLAAFTADTTLAGPVTLHLRRSRPSP